MFQSNLLHFMILVILSLIFGCNNDNTRIPKDSISPLVPGSKAVMISVSGAPKDLITRSTVTWGFNDNQGKFRLGGRALFEAEGGTLAGEIPREFFPEAIEVSYVIDYTNPMFTDVRSIYECPVRTSGVVSILSPASIFAKIKIGFRLPTTLNQNDHLSFLWHYSSEDTKQPEVEQQGSIWLPYYTLKRELGALTEREITFPLRNFRDGTVMWSLTGLINDKNIEEIEGKGQIKPYLGLLLISIGENGNITTIKSNPLPSEAVIGSVDSLQSSPCK